MLLVALAALSAVDYPQFFQAGGAEDDMAHLDGPHRAVSPYQAALGAPLAAARVPRRPWTACGRLRVDNPRCR